MKCDNLDSPNFSIQDDYPPSRNLNSRPVSSSPTSSLSFLSSGSDDSGSNSFSDFSSLVGGISGGIRREEAVVRRMLMEAATGRDSAAKGRERCVGRHDRVSRGFASVIGRRKKMEDAVTVVLASCLAVRPYRGCTASQLHPFCD